MELLGLAVAQVKCANLGIGNTEVERSSPSLTTEING